MNFKESICWLYSFKKYGSKLGLERISYLIKQLGNPQNTIKVIHVTGTNGKGSVCKFIGSILLKAGYNVGVYVSPHLQRFSERIIVNNEEISEGDVVLLVEKIKPVVDDMIKQNNTPTFFEVVTAMAFQFFSDCTVDFAVVEVGLGGRFDATNVVNPLVSVITNISLEHTNYLGEDIKSIAFEKAGIIKENAPVITAVKNDARDVIKKIAKEKNAHTIVINSNHWRRLSNNINYQEFLIQGAFNDYTVKTTLLGEYQGENIALALSTIEQLQMNGVYLTDDDVLEGISTTLNPGRIEIISKKPTVLLDGAHNPVGMKMLRKTLEEDFEYNRLVLLIGILKDKNIQKMLSTIAPISDIIIVTKSNNVRACEPEVLKNTVEKVGYKKDLFIDDSIPNAIEHAKSVTKEDDIICISGSLFTVGEARSYLVSLSKQIRRG
ncbi:MAG: bifunctional folylpolyglutamate synthase/dihydrofolate synthase [Thermoplasmatales archaeon]|nr:MAG: bifunctional folylpolyglutamate synthase/dihydrofolate synthase [Thermoplasmatales archaeon]